MSSLIRLTVRLDKRTVITKENNYELWASD